MNSYTEEEEAEWEFQCTNIYIHKLKTDTVIYYTRQYLTLHFIP